MAAPSEAEMALEIRPNCECYDRDLPPAATEVRICSYERTYCANRLEDVLFNLCPNCFGGFVSRPIRPVREWRPGLSLEKRPASTRRVHLSFDRENLAAHSQLIRYIPVESR